MSWRSSLGRPNEGQHPSSSCLPVRFCQVSSSSRRPTSFQIAFGPYKRTAFAFFGGSLMMSFVFGAIPSVELTPAFLLRTALWQPLTKEQKLGRGWQYHVSL